MVWALTVSVALRRGLVRLERQACCWHLLGAQFLTSLDVAGLWTWLSVRRIPVVLLIPLYPIAAQLIRQWFCLLQLQVAPLAGHRRMKRQQARQEKAQPSVRMLLRRCRQSPPAAQKRS